jgi:hypothetical protein
MKIYKPASVLRAVRTWRTLAVALHSRAVQLSAILACACSMGALACAPAPASARPAIEATGRTAGSAGGGSSQGANGSSLESAAAKAGNTGRAVAMSLIGLAFAVAGTVLAFRRDFKEAAGVFAVGIVAVLLATPTGVSLLRATVNSLFGSS